MKLYRNSIQQFSNKLTFDNSVQTSKFKLFFGAFQLASIKYSHSVILHLNFVWQLLSNYVIIFQFSCHTKRSALISILVSIHYWTMILIFHCNRESTLKQNILLPGRNCLKIYIYLVHFLVILYCMFAVTKYSLSTHFTKYFSSFVIIILLSWLL